MVDEIFPEGEQDFGISLIEDDADSMFPDPMRPNEREKTILAGKTAIALSGFKQGADLLQLREGYDTAQKEADMRKQAAFSYDSELDQTKNEVMQNYLAMKANRNESYTPEDVRFINELTRQQLSNPKAIIEKLYGERAVMLAQSGKFENDIANAVDEDEPKALDKVAGAQAYVAIQELAKRNVMDLQKVQEEQSTWDTVTQTAKTFLPGYTWYAQSNIIGQNNGFFLGDNKEEQYKKLFMMSPDEAAAEFTRIREQMDPLQALRFFEGMVHYGAQERGWDNFFSGADLSIALPIVGVGSVSGLGKLSAKGASTLGSSIAKADLAASLKGTVKGLAVPNVRPSRVIAESGDNLAAALVNILDEAGTSPHVMRQGESDNIVEATLMNIPAFADPTQFVQGATTLAAPTKERLLSSMWQTSIDLGRAIYRDVIPITRLGDQGSKDALKDSTLAVWNKQYSSATNGVLGVDFIPQVETKGNAAMLRIMVGDIVEGSREIPGQMPNLAPTGNTRVVARGVTETSTPEPRLGPNKPQFKRNLKAANEDNPPGLAIPGEESKTPFSTIEGGKGKNEVANLTYEDYIKRRERQNLTDGHMSREMWEMSQDVLNPPPAAPKLKPGDTIFLTDNTGRTPVKFVGMTTDGNYLIDLGDGKVLKAYRGAITFDEKKSASAGITRAKGKPSKAIKLKPSNDNYAVQFGDKHAEYFTSKESAERAAKEDYGFSQFNVKQQGSGWYIEVFKHVDETNPNVWDALAIHTKEKTPLNLGSALVTAIRSPNYTLPGEIAKAIIHAAQGSNAVVKQLEATAKAIGSLNGKSQRRLSDFLNMERMERDPVTKQLGVDSKNIGELEQRWLKRHNSLPNEQEVKAYAYYKQLYDMEWGINNLHTYTAKARLGLEEFDITFAGGVAPRIEGKFLNEFPSDDAMRGQAVFVFDKTKVQRRQYIGKKSIEDLQRQGYQIIHVSPTGQRQLREIPGLGLPKEQHFDYIMVKDIKTHPLSYNQVPKRPGIHHEYGDDWKVVQGDIKTSGEVGSVWERTYYNGDNIGTMAKTSSDGKRKVAAYEGVRTRFLAISKERDPAKQKALKQDLVQFISKNMPGNYKYWYGKFMGPKKTFNLEHPFAVVERNSNYGDTVGLQTLPGVKNLLKSSDNPNNIYNGDVTFKFAQERSNDVLLDWHRTGNAVNPVWNFKPAAMVNPLDSLSRVVQSFARDRYMGDIKTKMAQWFTSEFSHLMDANGLDELRHNPFQVLINPPWSAEAANNPYFAAARKFSITAREFMNMQNRTQQWFNYQRQRVADQIGDRFGLDKVDLFNEYAKSAIQQDPVQVFRKLAFHTKLGLFNPVQMFKQSMSFAHIAAIEGAESAAKSFGAGFAMRGYFYNPSPAMLDHAADIAAKWGWKKEEFKEAAQYYKRFDYGHPGREQSYLDQLEDSRLVSTKFGQFLDAGLWFYNAGESFVRQTAWLASYRKWRIANPIAKFGPDEAQDVLARATLLGGDMVGALNSSWQKGIFSTATQFTSYQTRLMEQMLGGRLTNAEKRRVFLTYSTIFGLPVGAATAVGVWPIHEQVRESMVARGIDPNNSLIATAAVNGAAGLVQQMILGEQYNSSDAYGPSGLSQFKDIFDGNKTWLDVMAGATGSTTFGLIQSTEPLYAALFQSISGEDTGHELTTQDWNDLLSNISSWSNARKAVTAVQMGKYFSKSGQQIGDVTAFDGLMIAAFGLTPSRIVDMYDKIQVLKDQKAYRDEIERDVTKAYRSAFQAQDDEDRMKFIRRAQAILTTSALPMTDHALILRRAVQLGKHEDQIDQINARLARTSLDRLEMIRGQQ